MTEENRRANIALEVAKVERRLASARALLDLGDFEGAETQAYFHAFHCARALLLLEGLEARTHAGVPHLVNQHFVRTGRLAPEIARLLPVLEREREEADYDAAAVVTEAMAQDAIARSADYGQAVRSVLAGAGMLGSC